MTSHNQSRNTWFQLGSKEQKMQPATHRVDSNGLPMENSSHMLHSANPQHLLVGVMRAGVDHRPQPPPLGTRQSQNVFSKQVREDASGLGWPSPTPAERAATYLPLAECLAVILSSSFLPDFRSCLPSMEPTCTAFSGSQKVICEFSVATASSAPSGRKVTARARGRWTSGPGGQGIPGVHRELIKSGDEPGSKSAGHASWGQASTTARPAEAAQGDSHRAAGDERVTQGALYGPVCSRHSQGLSGSA